MPTAAKHFDVVVGLDMHLVQAPGPVPPVPIPHPFVGIVFDPFDYLPVLGTTVHVNGLPRAQSGQITEPVRGVVEWGPSSLTVAPLTDATSSTHEHVELRNRMKLAIHGVSCHNHPNLRTWIPDDPSDFAEYAIIGIGMKGKKGSDDFTFLLATPRGLARLPSKSGIIGSRALLVMEEYGYDALWAWLEQTVKKCERDTWHECVQELRLYFIWEYEGMEAG